MRPIPIPDHQVFDGARRITIGAPPGLESVIQPVEALAVEVEGNPTYLVLLEVEASDQNLIEHGRTWLMFMGGIAPFSFASYFPEMTLEHECNRSWFDGEDTRIQICLKCGRVSKVEDLNGTSVVEADEN